MNEHTTSLIITTAKDISLEYLKNEHTSVIYFEQDFKDFELILTTHTYGVIYIRDPFNNPPYEIEDIKARLRLLYESQPAAYYIDGTQDINKVFFEDKWIQYQTLSDFMAPTITGKKGERICEGKIAKKRISARSRDILFTGSILPGDDWIIQDMLHIKEELRVYAVNGVIIPLASIKQSKASDQKTKVVGLRELTDQETDFVQEIVDKLPWIEFVGLDIVICVEGLRLLEANRAPQFKKYTELTGENIAERLLEIR